MVASTSTRVAAIPLDSSEIGRIQRRSERRNKVKRRSFTSRQLVFLASFSLIVLLAASGQATEEWKGTPVGAPWVDRGQTAIWTGTEMIVWGGTYHYRGGGCYNLATDTWRPISNTKAPRAEYDHIAVWTGTEMIIWVGANNTGGRYDPAMDRWSPISTAGAPSPRSWPYRRLDRHGDDHLGRV